MVRTLAAGDTRLDLPDTSGRTVLHLAAMMTQETGIVMANFINLQPTSTLYAKTSFDILWNISIMTPS